MHEIKTKNTRKKFEMVGRQFGCLLVLRETRVTGIKANKFTVKCVKCGFTYESNGSNIRRHGANSAIGCKKCAVGNPTSRKIEMVCEEFGDLFVSREADKSNSKHSMFVVSCMNCGSTYEAFGSSIRKHKENNVPGCKECHVPRWNSVGRPTHGMSKHPIFKVWLSMKARCYDNKHHAFSSYGGRGILICDSWKSDPKVFITWAIENNWKHGLEVDRRDNDKGYCPENCRIVTKTVNQNNRRNNRRIILNGNSLTVAEASRKTGINKATITGRLNRGWSDEKACSPVKTYGC